MSLTSSTWSCDRRRRNERTEHGDTGHRPHARLASNTRPQALVRVLHDVVAAAGVHRDEHERGLDDAQRREHTHDSKLASATLSDTRLGAEQHVVLEDRPQGADDETR